MSIIFSAFISRLILALLLGFFLLACQNETPEPVIFNGICDGSASVRAGRQQLLVANDETNAIYAFDNTGSLLRSYSFDSLLELPGDGETDIEAASVHGQSIWWIGSHGRDSSGELATNRELLFKTNIPQMADKLIVTEGPYNLVSLINRIVDQQLERNTLSRAPKKGGLNIEGLAFTPGGDFLVGLRSPLSRGSSGDASVLRLALEDGEFEFVANYTLDLNDRGIRDLVASKNGYLLIAGGVGGGGIFSLFKWDITGKLEKVLDFPEGFNAEALVNMGSYWLVLSDDGKVKRSAATDADGSRSCDELFKGNEPAAKLESVYFRGLLFLQD